MGHVPVLLNETLECLDVKKKFRFVDGTIGDGGHAIEILKINPKSKVLGIDLDQTSLDKLREKLIHESLSQRCILAQGNYKDIGKIVSENNFGKVDGILLDLGFSSSQLDDPKRGLSFQQEGPLDMRYNPNNHLSAERVVNEYSADKLTDIIEEFGEEKFAKRIAGAIVAQRKTKPIKTTLELVETVRKAIPGQLRFKANDNIRRVFQAIRIEVNHELENLREFLSQSLAVLNPGGRIAIISFHSLEDRIVKEFFQKEAKDCVCPPEFPICICGKSSIIRILTRKPIMASDVEQINNPRSKSAKLRVAEKI